MATSLFLRLRLAASYRWIGHMALDDAIKTYLRSVPVGTTHTTFAMISRCNDKWAVSTLPTSQTAKWSSIRDVQNHATWAGGTQCTWVSPCVLLSILGRSWGSGNLRRRSM